MPIVRCPFTRAAVARHEMKDCGRGFVGLWVCGFVGFGLCRSPKCHVSHNAGAGPANVRGVVPIYLGLRQMMPPPANDAPGRAGQGRAEQDRTEARPSWWMCFSR